MSNAIVKKSAAVVAQARLPPGPRAPSLINALRWAFQPVRFLEACGRAYGDMFTVRFPFLPPYVFVTDPDSMRDVFNAEPDELQAGKVAQIMEPVFGKEALSLLDGERHLAERKLLSPPFHGERMTAYGEVMRAIADEEIDQWVVGQPFPIHGPMQSITLKVIFRGVLGTSDQESERLRGLLATLLDHAMNPVMLMPWTHVDLGALTPYRAFMRTRAELDAVLRKVIEDRRLEDLSDRVDVLSMLIQAGNTSGAPMSTTQLRDHMVALLVTGHETTATALAWAFHYALADRTIFERMNEELLTVTGGGRVELAHLPKLEYIDAVLKESLRVVPVIPLLGRWMENPMRLGTNDLPGGVVITPCIYLAHRRPEAWPNPEKFDPLRFLGVKRSPFEYFPFGGGSRRCIGMHFAFYEMKVVMAQVLSRTTLEAVPGYRGRIKKRHITFIPEGGMPLTVVRKGPVSPG